MTAGDELSDWAEEASARMANRGSSSPVQGTLATRLEAVFTGAARAAGRADVLDGTKLEVSTEQANAHFRFGDSRLTIEWDGTDEDLAELTVYFFKFLIGQEDED
jgi:hypothetical protein